MPTGLIIIILGVASVAGAAGYLSAYFQISHLYVAREARRRALGAAVGPFVFYAILGVILRLAIPFMLHQ
jgi:hypothetical protein